MLAGSSILGAFIGGLQASLSVLLILGYGVIASRLGLLHQGAVKDISKLCNKMFLPALMIYNVGSQLSPSELGKYGPVLLWSTTYILVSILLGWIAVRFFKYPAWVTLAAGFNNTTSLPLLLVQSLASTNVLQPLLQGNETMAQAIHRAKAYFLIGSVIKNVIVIAVAQKLLNAEEGKTDDHQEDGSAQHEQDGHQDDHPQPTEQTSLLPVSASNRIDSLNRKWHNEYHRLPTGVQSVGKFLQAFVNPASVGASIAIILALIPVLHKAFFNNFEDGGWFKPWLTTSIQNIGELFTALQMFVVGSQLDHILSSKSGKSKLSKSALGVAFFIRFIFWGVVSIGVIYLLASRTNFLSDDPILWFAMMLMPIGPPAMILATTLEVSGASEEDQFSVSEALAVFYAITPVICVAVAGALKASEMAMAARGM